MLRTRFFLRGLATAKDVSTPGKVVTAGKLRLNLLTPSTSVLRETEVDQVNISSTGGDMGILPNHVPAVAQLKPGVIEILTGKETKKYFATGGFAIVNEDSTLNINCIETYNLDEFDNDAIRRGLAEAKKAFETTTAPLEKAKAEVELDVYTALANATGVQN